MHAILFDLDHTLYNQREPFDQAVRAHFSLEGIPLAELYQMSRQFSDAVFPLTETGQMSVTEMHIYRIKEAFAHFGRQIATDEALAFQADYARRQAEIKLIPDMRQTLAFCQQQGITMGVITNGPLAHQHMKLKQLQVTNWLPAEHLFISSAVGYAKPAREIFALAERELNLIPEQTYYVGDSFQNDMIGAKQAGWQTIWSNRDEHDLPKTPVVVDYQIDDNHSLLKLVQLLLAS